MDINTLYRLERELSVVENVTTDIPALRQTYCVLRDLISALIADAQSQDDSLKAPEGMSELPGEG